VFLIHEQLGNRMNTVCNIRTGKTLRMNILSVISEQLGNRVNTFFVMLQQLENVEIKHYIHNIKIVGK
jgi:hypothetical protein